MASVEVKARSGGRGVGGAVAGTGGPRPTRRLRRPLALVLAGLFFFGPALAAAAGVRARPFENRALPTFPALSRGWQFFGAFDDWATAHLPLRDKAVRAQTSLSRRVFSENPRFDAAASGPPVAVGAGAAGAGTPVAGAGIAQVLAGRSGWLYYGGDFSNPCSPTLAVPEVMSRLERLQRLVVASGRRFAVVVAPDKSTLEPGHLPASYPGKACSAAVKDAFWARLRSAPPPGYLDLRGPLERAKAAENGPVYRPTDTHWNQRGVATYAEVLATWLDPRLWSTTTVRPTGPQSRIGDLGVLLGAPHTDTYPGYALDRPGTTTTAPVSRSSAGAPYSESRASTAGAPLFNRPVLLLGDSFTQSARSHLYGFFSDLRIMHPEAAVSRPQGLVDQVVAADVVIYEVVERSANSGKSPMLDTGVLDRLEAALAAAPRR